MSRTPEENWIPTIRRLFDDAWYVTRYPEVASSRLEPITHYLEVGDAAGCWPHPLFDPDFYSEQCPDLVKEGGARLRHYLEQGEASGIWPSPLFDPSYYLSSNPDLKHAGGSLLSHFGSLLSHFSRHGAAEMRSPNPLFAPKEYCHQLPGRPEALEHPLLDYVAYGDAAGVLPHPLFDAVHYGAQHPDIPSSGGARLAHYLCEGARADSSPHPLFQVAFYLQQRSTPLANGMTPLADYLIEGESQDFFPNPLFDPQFYLEENPDLLGSASLLTHYVQSGAEEGRRPNGLFSPVFYQEQIRELGLKKSELLAHYLEHGDEEGLLPHPLFDPAYYEAQQSETNDRLGNRLAHYLEHGHGAQGRPHPLFHPDYYASQVSTLIADKTTLLSHYLEFGDVHSLKPNPLFDPVHYAKQVDPNGGTLLELYLLSGGQSGLDPSPLFDSSWVSDQIPLRSRDRMNPLEYYFRENGQIEKGPHPLFLPVWYASEYPDAQTSDLDALSYFMEVGALREHDPHPLFDSRWYRDVYFNHFDDSIPSIFHYLELGQRFGLCPNALFDPDYYLRHHAIELRPGETALAHFCRVGLEARYRPSPLFSFCLQFFRDRDEARRKRSSSPAGGYFSALGSSATSPEAEIPAALTPAYQPDVSIIIPMHGQLCYSLACLRSISRSENDATYEVILVDDHSPAEHAAVLAQVENLRILRNEEQLGFLHSCNRGASEARGQDLIFLNNDTLVTNGWIDQLLATREAFPNAGLIGSKLLFPNGRLQEAGSVVWSDGSALNYGYGEDPADPRFSFARTVDYVSAAAALIRSETFQDLGGFDERFAPAFYEDTDLAFRVREAGMDVVYQPASEVIHFGGASHGQDTATNSKHHQVVNQGTFLHRWKTILAEHNASTTDPDHAALRLGGPRALIVDAAMLTPNQDSGSLRMYHLLQVLRNVGFSATFMPVNLHGAKEDVGLLQRNGVQVVCSPYVSSIERFLEEFGAEFELCIVSRPDTAETCLDLVKLLCPNALVLYDTVDLHFLRRERELRLTGVAPASDSIRTQELWAVAHADGTIAVSHFDREKLIEKVPSASVHVISNIHKPYPRSTPFSERDGVLFIGGFQHSPNVDAVLWFIADVLPIIHETLPHLRFHIIGKNPPDKIRDQASEHVIVEGYLEDIDHQFSTRRLSVAPLRYGSGVKGKINQSMAYGLPCVATPPAVEGMDVDWESEILVAKDAHGFAQAVLALHQNEELWSEVATNSISSIERSYSMQIAEQGLREILRHHGRTVGSPPVPR